MKFHLLAATALVLMTTSFAQAAFNADAITAQYKADGYTRIELKIGQRTAKIEAFKGNTKIEVTYDIASGDIIKSETETFTQAPNVRPGVFVRNVDDKGGRGDDSDGDDDHGGHDDDDDHNGRGDDDRGGRHGGGDD